MAVFKRRIFLSSTGKHIKLYGTSVAIRNSMEFGEGYTSNIFSAASDLLQDKNSDKVSNPYRLTTDELMELADFSMQLWMDLKNKLRKYGADDAKVFGLQASMD